MKSSQSEDISTAELQAEVASFAAGLGFAAGSGFNDADFLKKGPIVVKGNQKRKQASNDIVPTERKLKIAKTIPNARSHSTFKGKGLTLDGPNLKDRNTDSQTHGQTEHTIPETFVGLAKFWKHVGHMLFSDSKNSSLRWFEAASELATVAKLGHNMPLHAANVAFDDLIQQKRTEAEML